MLDLALNTENKETVSVTEGQALNMLRKSLEEANSREKMMVEKHDSEEKSLLARIDGLM